MRKAFFAAHPKAPCVKGPQESAACGGCGDLKPPLGDQGEVARRSRDGGDQNRRPPQALWRSAVPNNPSVMAKGHDTSPYTGEALATAFDEGDLTAQLTGNTSQALRASSPQGEPWAISFGESSQAPPPSGRAMRAPTVGIAASASNQAKKSPRRTGGILIRGSCDLRIRD
mgnify:CR=1 FL=1